MKKIKVFRDPIHNYIYVNNPIVWRLINTKAFQRLQHIHQLGGAFQVFHGAVHTRFGHSLGAYHVAKQILENVEGLNEKLTEREKQLFLVASLLHDLGHGPFSHASELFLKQKHEKISCEIILYDQEIRTILDTIDQQFAHDIVAIISKKYQNELLIHMVSSQIDVDRMDYLLRDAYYAGVPYGHFDMTRLFRVMRIVENKIVYADSGVPAIEAFIMSRFHMHQQVYNNIKARGFEYLLSYSMQRFCYLVRDKKIAYQQDFLYQKLYEFLFVQDVQSILAMDDHLFMAIQHQFLKEPDDILRMLAQQIVYRKLPYSYEISEVEAKKIKSYLEGINENNMIKYQIILDEVKEKSLYDEKKEQIQLIDKKHNLSTLSESSVIFAQQKLPRKTKYYLHVDRSLKLMNNNDISEIKKLLASVQD